MAALVKILPGVIISHAGCDSDSISKSIIILNTITDLALGADEDAEYLIQRDSLRVYLVKEC